jgi:GTP pyrophosphokinase
MHSERLTEAFDYAAKLHAAHTRKGIDCPYLSHLLGVASFVLEYGGSEDAVVAALLHDAVEDQGGADTLERIRERFGSHVAAVVEQCSDSIEALGVEKPDWEVRKRVYIAALQTKLPDALLVTACDKLHNASAILADHDEAQQVGGAPVWDRFGGKPAAQVVSYYSALRSELSGKIPAALQRRFARVVGKLEQAVDDVERQHWVERLLAA